MSDSQSSHPSTPKAALKEALVFQAQRLKKLGVKRLPSTSKSKKGALDGGLVLEETSKAISSSQLGSIDAGQVIARAGIKFPVSSGEIGLAAIQKTLGDCQRCNLCSTRTNIVFGQGNPQASLVFVGEGPGAEEDKTGLPFVGAAGELLNKMIVAMKLQRSDVYICNVVKCRPPGNRVPENVEINTCSPFLWAQLLAIKPRIIVCLGKTPTQHLLGKNDAMGKLRGVFDSWNNIPVVPTYHPAYLLRNPAAKKDVWEDLQKVMQFLGLK